jgi:hypothetical protein
MSNESEWASRVGAWRESGKSAATFCEGRDYSATTLYWWSSRLKRKSAPAKQRKRVPIARVVRTTIGGATSKPTSIVVQLGHARVEVPAGADRATLSTVLDALASAPWRVGP